VLLQFSFDAVGRTDESDIDIELAGSANRACDGLSRGEVAAHGIEGNLHALASALATFQSSSPGGAVQ
jgi:hypothetical protein